MADITGSRACLVEHELLCAGFSSEGSEEGCSMEWRDWDSCSDHSACDNSSSTSSGSDCPCPCPYPPSPPHHPPPPPPPSPPQQHHQRQRQRPKHPTSTEEVMFYHSTKGLWDSLAYITSMTDMCDVIFHVGNTRHPVYGVKSLLSVRSRVMYLEILQAQRTIKASLKNRRRRLRHSSVDTDVTMDGRVHIDVTDYDAKVFSQLVDFLHSGRVKVNLDTALGLYCAATEYEVPDLRTACWDFVDRCVQRGHVTTLLASGRAYLGRKSLDKLRRQFLKT